MCLLANAFSSWCQTAPEGMHWTVVIILRSTFVRPCHIDILFQLLRSDIQADSWNVSHSKHFGVSSFEAGHSRRQLCGCQWISSSLLSGLLHIGPRLIGHIANLLLCGSLSLNVFKFTIMVVNAWGSHLTVAVSLCEHIPAGFTKHKVNLVCRPHWAWWPYSHS